MNLSHWDLIQLLSQSFTQHSDRIALQDGATQYSYRQIEQCSDALGQWLTQQFKQQLGTELRPNRPVAIRLPRGPLLFISLLTLLRLRIPYLSLEPSLPEPRVQQLLADAEAQCLLGEPLTESHLADAAVMSLNPSLSQLQALSASHSPLQPIGPAHPDQPVYLIYTSGSSGQPKAVWVGQQAIALHLDALSQLYQLNSEDRVLHLISTSFDGAIEAWLLPWLAGARLVIGHPASLTPHDTNQQLLEQQISVLGVSPAYLQQMALSWREAGTPGTPPLRSYTVGGEALTAMQFQQITDIFQPPRLFNGYGPTECVITPLLWSSLEPAPEGLSVMPIGRPVGPRQAQIVDADGNPLPDGVSGELRLEGLLAQGYWRRPRLTAQHFTPADNGQRQYRTGDLARREPNGLFLYQGRLDSQLKLRGLRIEPGEIENRLLAHPQVREAAIRLLPTDSGAQLVAYVAPELDAQQLRQFIAPHLPDYMLPSAWVMLPRLPRLASGKLDSQNLPKPQSSQAFVEPQGPIEQQLAQHWAQLLKLPRVGRFDHFFELGGHSLLAARLVAQLRHQWQIDLSLRSLFEQPRLADFAQVLTKAAWAIRLVTPEITAAAATAAQPASPLQTSLWHWARHNPHNPALHLYASLQIQGALDIGRLQQAWHGCLRRYANLSGQLPSNQPLKIAVIGSGQSAAEIFCDLQRLACYG